MELGSKSGYVKAQANQCCICMYCDKLKKVCDTYEVPISYQYYPVCEECYEKYDRMNYFRI